jgi:hypothetical protein
MSMQHEANDVIEQEWVEAFRTLDAIKTSDLHSRNVIARDRHRTTGNWIFDKSEYISWMEYKNKILWIHGPCE